jgi:hypothetical protein
MSKFIVQWGRMPINAGTVAGDLSLQYPEPARPGAVTRDDFQQSGHRQNTDPGVHK